MYLILKIKNLKEKVACCEHGFDNLLSARKL